MTGKKTETGSGEGPWGNPREMRKMMASCCGGMNTSKINEFMSSCCAPGGGKESGTGGQTSKKGE